MSVVDFDLPDELKDMTADEFCRQMLARIPKEIDTTEGSFTFDMIKSPALLAAELVQFWLVLELKNSFHMWAVGRWLDCCATDCGLARREATHAYGDIHVTADPFLTFPQGFVFSVPSENGEPAIDFELVEEQTVPESGQLTARIKAVLSGKQGNVRADTITIMKNPVDNVYLITNDATSGGTEIEGDDSLRARIDDFYAGRQASYVGNKKDYTRWAKSVPGVGFAHCIPLYFGANSLKLVIADANGQPAAPEILEWFDYGGEPYHFKIRSHGFKHPSEQWPTFWRGLCTAKNVRSWPDNFELIYDEEPVPIYAGIADLHGGEVEISLDKPKFFNSETRAFAATADLLTGNKAISLQRPNLNFGGKMFVGQALTKSGYIKIDTSTKPHDTEDLIAHSWKAKIFAETVNLVHGRQIWSMSRPKNQQANLISGTVDLQTGAVTVQPSKIRDSQTTITAGQVLTKVGEIRIGTSTQPTSTENFFGHSSTAKVHAQTVLSKSGDVKIDGTQAPKKHYSVVRVGQVLTCSGFVTIGAGDSDWHDLPEDGDWLRLRFRFPNLSKRFVTLPDPRDDLEKDDIREVGNFAAEKGMLLNSAREPTNGIDLAMLIKRNIRKIF